MVGNILGRNWDLLEGTGVFCLKIMERNGGFVFNLELFEDQAMNLRNLQPCGDCNEYTLWKFVIAIEHGHRKFVSFPIKNIVIFHSSVTNYQRVIEMSLGRFTADPAVSSPEPLPATRSGVASMLSDISCLS